jgi:hypothetical protein
VTRNCKVITTCFAGRTVREETTICGDPPGPFMHAQNFPDAESVLELVELIHEFELEVDPGLECDTILVNQDVGWEKGNRYLSSLDGSRTFAGHLRVLTKDNFGNSLGGYNHAYELLRDGYDYWTFTEDDILITGPGWLRRCIDTFERQEKAGFVALQGLSSEFALHAHAGMGTTHVRVLDAVRAFWGALPHRQRQESQRDVDHIVFGEVMFTHIIKRLGYELVTVDSPEPLYTYAYEHIKRTRGPRQPAVAPVRVPAAVPPPEPHAAPRAGLVPRALRRVAGALEGWAQRIE